MARAAAKRLPMPRSRLIRSKRMAQTADGLLLQVSGCRSRFRGDLKCRSFPKGSPGSIRGR